MKDNTITVAVTTAPREGGSLLPRCLRSLCATGFVRPLVFAEPGSLVPTRELAKVIGNSERLGAWHNWQNALCGTIRANPKARAVLVIQDDVVFCRRLAEFLPTIMWPSRKCGLIQVVSSYTYRHLPRGVVRVPDNRAGAGLAGAWASLIPMPIARELSAVGRLLGWKGAANQQHNGEATKAGIDQWLGQVLVKLGYEVWLCNPSLGLHDATHSTIGHGPSDQGNLRSLSFPGVDADPFAVLKPPAVQRSVK